MQEIDISSCPLHLKFLLRSWVRFWSFDDINEWRSYKYSDESTYTRKIPNLSTRSHPSEEKNRRKNESVTFLTSDIFNQF